MYVKNTRSPPSHSAHTIVINQSHSSLLPYRKSEGGTAYSAAQNAVADGTFEGVTLVKTFRGSAEIDSLVCRYVKANIAMSEGWRKRPSAVPFAMHHRPPDIVQHTTRQFKAATDAIPADHVTSVGDCTYSVNSSSSLRQYVVTTGVEKPYVVLLSCECYAWNKSHQFVLQNFWVLLA